MCVFFRILKQLTKPINIKYVVSCRLIQSQFFLYEYINNEVFPIQMLKYCFLIVTNSMLLYDIALCLFRYCYKLQGCENVPLEEGLPV
jgi:hypothetical protein